MMGAEIEGLVFSLLREIAPGCNPERLKPDDEIRRTLDIDSFDYLRFIVSLSNKIGRDIPEEDYSRLSTMNKLQSYLSGEKSVGG